MSTAGTPTEAEIIKAVQDAYDAKAVDAGLSDLDHVSKVAEAFGYTSEELLSIPNEANLGLSCGNPVGAATLKEGETVLDLGSGAGMDVFLAASKVGLTGKVVGIDGSIEMIARARRAAQTKNIRPPQVAFVHSQLTEPLPIVDDSVDCVLSNCVLNLLPVQGKQLLVQELTRILRPGGRLVLDDIIAKRPLSSEIKNDLKIYVNCISGAIQLEEYRALLKDAGFVDTVFVETKNDLNLYYTSAASSCCSSSTPMTQPALSTKPDFDVNEWVASYQIFAIKPSQNGADQGETEKPLPLLRWWDAYPKAKSSPKLMPPEEFAALLRGTSKDFIAIDVRRDDYNGYCVKGCANWPSQTFYDRLPLFLEQYKNTRKVVFYCGSSSGRGPRCAGWYQDYLNETGTTTSQAYVLQGGVKAWIAKYLTEGLVGKVEGKE